MSTETPNNLHTKPKQSNKRGGGKGKERKNEKTIGIKMRYTKQTNHHHRKERAVL